MVVLVPDPLVAAALIVMVPPPKAVTMVPLGIPVPLNLVPTCILVKELTAVSVLLPLVRLAVNVTKV